MLYIVLIFKWSFMNLQFVINIPTVKVLAYRKYHKRWFKYVPDQPSKLFLRYGISLTTL